MSSGLQEGDTVAYPDPILLAFKTSVNWTHEYNFQLIAEAEPPPLEPSTELDGLEETHVSADDENSFISAVSAITLSLHL
jgi:hypothetical protein